MLHWVLRTIVVFERALHAGLSTLISANEPLMPVNAACLRTLFPFSALLARRRGMAVNGYALITWKWPFILRACARFSPQRAEARLEEEMFINGYALKTR